jgi:NADPH:quinone reductase-like Zn-dependent oxidoreductase
MVRSIGADRVIDYTQADFSRQRRCYDLILDCVGNHSLSAFRRVVKPTGAYVIVGGPSGRWMIGLLARMSAALVLSALVSQKLGVLMTRRSKEDLTILRELLATGAITPVIDKRFRLSDVPQAVRHVELGHARGKVVITVEGE